VTGGYALHVLTGWFDAFAVAFGVVLLAELGDKTQLMVLGFSTRYRAWPVAIGVVFATALMMAVTVVVGAALGAVIPAQMVQLVGGVAFLAFAAWTVFGGDDDESDAGSAMTAHSRARSPWRIALLVGSAFALAELGDKSMLATLTLATQAQPVATWAGATLAMIGASLLAVVVGRQIGTRIPRRLVRYVAAAAFAVFGVLLLFEALA
jgi:Ca2+/H+ antiporter, TMEM165/GDT1 family